MSLRMPVHASQRRDVQTRLPILMAVDDLVFFFFLAVVVPGGLGFLVPSDCRVLVAGGVGVALAAALAAAASSPVLQSSSWEFGDENLKLVRSGGDGAGRDPSVASGLPLVAAAASSASISARRRSISPGDPV